MFGRYQQYQRNIYFRSVPLTTCKLHGFPHDFASVTKSLGIFVPTHFLEVCLVILKLKITAQEEWDLEQSPQVALAQIDALKP